MIAALKMCCCVTFVSKSAYNNDIKGILGLGKMVLPVSGCWNIGKKEIIYNNAVPHIEVSPETYQVKADGKVIECEPSKTLPLTQRYYQF